MDILLASDGSVTAEKNTRILSTINFPPDTRYMLTAVRGEGGSAPDLSGVKQVLDRMGVRYRDADSRAVNEEGLLDEVHDGSYDLVVDLRGRHKAPLFRLGQATSPLAQSIDSTLLLAHPAPDSLKRILLCSGGETTSEMTICEAGRWLRYTEAEIHILHVMSQVPLDVAHASEDLNIEAEAAMEFETREGQHLKRGAQWLRDAGISSEIIPVLRYGLVVDEILEELAEGRYDMLVVGAHLRTKNRLLNLLLEDITDKLIARVKVPVLIVRIHPLDQIQSPIQ